MVKPEKFGHIHLVDHFAVPVSKLKYELTDLHKILQKLLFY